jgi:hypothetical protein
VAVNDGVDSKRGDSEFTAIRNVFNQMFAQDTSKKIRATLQSKGKSEHLTSIPPYGFMKNPNDPKRWLVDEEAAAVVQKIFSLCVDGKGPTQIATWLRANNIVIPSVHMREKGLPVAAKSTKNPYRWCNEAVSTILERIEYLGHTVNFRKTKESYKSNKILINDPDKWVIIENTHDAIIEENIFQIVQNLRQSRKRPTKMGYLSMFSGMLYCADCGGKMYQHRAHSYKKRDESYICSSYIKDSSDCSTHTIRNVVLEEIVLKNLREAISYVSHYQDDFIREASDVSLREQERDSQKNRNEIKRSENRIAELDSIIKRLYEDNISGKLTDERFIKLSGDYEREQGELKANVKALSRDLKSHEQKKGNVQNFIAAAKKYTDLQELDATVLHEFIDRIIIAEADKETKTRHIEIVYNFIGAFDFSSTIEQSQNKSGNKKSA